MNFCVPLSLFRLNCMRVLYVIGGLAQNNGGPAYSVPRLCSAVRRADIEASIATLAEEGLAELNDTTFFPASSSNIPILRQLKLSSAMHRGVRNAAKKVDVVHSHGLWIAPNVYAGRAAAAASKPLVVSPRGMMSPGALTFSKHKKRLVWSVWQGPAYRSAALWHATSSQEANEIREFGIKAPIVVIPNGIDVPDRVASHSPKKPQRTLLFLSRIHPKKGLPALIEAWRQLAAERPDWQVLIVGPDEVGHRASVEALVLQKQIPRVTFLDPVFGKAKEDLLIIADLFVLPTMSENFGMAVAEALSVGVPAIVTKGAPWEGLDANRCGWWIDQGVEPLLRALRDATALPAHERRSMGLRGRNWMRRDFSWDAIGREMAAAYRWISCHEERPSCVYSA